MSYCLSKDEELIKMEVCDRHHPRSVSEMSESKMPMRVI